MINENQMTPKHKPKLDLTGRKIELYNRLSKEIEFLKKQRSAKISKTGALYKYYTKQILLFRAIQKLLDEIFMGDSEES